MICWIVWSSSQRNTIEGAKRVDRPVMQQLSQARSRGGLGVYQWCAVVVGRDRRIDGLSRWKRSTKKRHRIRVSSFWLEQRNRRDCVAVRAMSVSYLHLQKALYYIILWISFWPVWLGGISRLFCPIMLPTEYSDNKSLVSLSLFDVARYKQPVIVCCSGMKYFYFLLCWPFSLLKQDKWGKERERERERWSVARPWRNQSSRLDIIIADVDGRQEQNAAGCCRRSGLGSNEGRAENSRSEAEARQSIVLRIVYSAISESGDLGRTMRQNGLGDR
jgi:hypothetical protein